MKNLFDKALSKDRPEPMAYLQKHDVEGSPDDKELIAMVNKNRKTIMNGMGKAIVRINRVPENEQNLKQAMPQAVEQFASIRRDSAQKGWWIQDSYGNWSRK